MMNFQATMFANFSKVTGKRDFFEVIEEIINGRYATPVNELRNAIEDGNTERAKKLKSKLPAAACALYSEKRLMEHLTAYYGIIPMDMDAPANLTRAKMLVEDDPHTLANVISPGGKGLKFFVRATLPDGSLPTGSQEILAFHKAAYAQAEAHYSTLTGEVMDTSGSDPGRLFFMSYDPDGKINRNAQTFICNPLAPATPFPPENGCEAAFNLAVAATNKKETFKEHNHNNYLCLLCNNCNRKGIPEADTLRFCLAKYSAINPKELEAIVTWAYKHAAEHGKRRKRKDKDETLLIDAIEEYMSAHHDFRYNEISTRIECRKKGAAAYSTLDDRGENSLWRAIQKEGVMCRIAEVRQILGSDFIPSFNPFRHYFDTLPAWEGKDHLATLVETVTTTHPEFWDKCLRKWMVAMIASLLMDDVENQTVLLVTGEQGIGKSSWVRLLLPPELRAYYTLGSFSEKPTDLMLKLSAMGIVNIDEFDSLRYGEMSKLKMLITQGDINERQAYAHHARRYVRHASFVSTSNNMKLMNDPTGSRRFLGFEATHIRYRFRMDYRQLYAQLYHLLNSGFRYWFDEDEIKELNSNNEDFQLLTPEEEFLFTYFRKPLECDTVLQLTASDILKRISSRTGLNLNNIGVMNLGRILKKYRFVGKRGKSSTKYEIAELNVEEVEKNYKKQYISTQSNLSF